MADAVMARWHGDNYQARVFWENAFNLLLPNSSVVEVTFEANGPKAFDDVVVKYDPAVARGEPMVAQATPGHAQKSREETEAEMARLLGEISANRKG